MSSDNRPTMEEFSLYYDGLLEGEVKKRVEEYLATIEEPEIMLSLFKQFDQALEPCLPDEEVNRLLSTNLQEIHDKIYRTEQRVTETGWRFSDPEAHSGSGFALMFIAAGVSLMQQEHPNQQNQIIVKEDRPIPQPTVHSMDLPQNQQIAQSPPANPGPSRNRMEDQPQVSEAQKQMILALAQYAKNAVNSGVETITEQTQGIRAEVTGNIDDSGTKPVDQIARLSRQQVAIGLGASMLSMMMVF